MPWPPLPRKVMPDNNNSLKAFSAAEANSTSGSPATANKRMPWPPKKEPKTARNPALDDFIDEKFLNEAAEEAELDNDLSQAAAKVERQIVIPQGITANFGSLSNCTIIFQK